MLNKKVTKANTKSKAKRKPEDISKKPNPKSTNKNTPSTANNDEPEQSLFLSSMPNIDSGMPELKALSVLDVDLTGTSGHTPLFLRMPRACAVKIPDALFCKAGFDVLEIFERRAWSAFIGQAIFLEIARRRGKPPCSEFVETLHDALHLDTGSGSNFEWWFSDEEISAIIEVENTAYLALHEDLKNNIQAIAIEINAASEGPLAYRHAVARSQMGSDF